jgi:hypothetical protein
MKTIRTRLPNKSHENSLRRIRTRSFSDRFQSMAPASSRYNKRQTTTRNLNVTHQFLDDDIVEEEDIEEDDEMDMQNNGDNEPLSFDFESKIIEEQNLNTSYDGDYGPYFPNATTFMLFTWCTKHMISKY